MKKHNHSRADKIKPGSATIEVMQCDKCRKVIVKGKPTGMAFGRCKYLRGRVNP